MFVFQVFHTLQSDMQGNKNKHSFILKEHIIQNHTINTDRLKRKGSVIQDTC